MPTLADLQAARQQAQTKTPTLADLHAARNSQPLNANKQDISAGDFLRSTVSNAPNTTYGTILPVARNNDTGQTRFALPESLRSIVRGAADLSDMMEGKTREITPDAVGALMTFATGVHKPVSAFSKTAPIARNEMPLVSERGQYLPEQDLTSPSTLGALIDRKIASGASTLTQQAEETVKKLNTKTVIPSSDEMRGMGGAKINSAIESGATQPPQFTNEIFSEFKKLAPEKRMVSAAQGGKPTRSQQVADNLYNSEVNNTPMSFKDIQDLDSHLGDQISAGIDKYGKLDTSSKEIYQMQQALRKKVLESPGNEEWMNGKAMYAASYKMKDLERIQTLAEHSEKPATVIKTWARNMIANPKKLIGYDASDIKLLRKAAHTGLLTDAFRVFGSRLIPLGAAGISGPKGAILGYGLSEGSNAIAAGLQKSKLNNIQKNIVKNTYKKTGTPLPTKPIIGRSK